MKRKKILFVCYGLGIGGIETCLVNLINSLPENIFQIDVLLMNPEYALKKKVKRSVHYLDAYQYVMNTTDTMRQIKEHGGIIKEFGKMISYCRFRIRVKLQHNAWKTFKKVPEHYDVAIAYSQNDYSPYYVIDKVNADRKVMWYHNGAYERTGKKYERDQRYYNKFDYIVAVSSDCKKVLQSKFEFAKGKLIVLRNICDVPDILSKADQFVPESFDGNSFHVVTVGRMTKEKGADLAVEVCKELYDRALPIKWHWVGDGNQREFIEKKVEEYGLKDNFIFEGNQENPYPYIKCANVYVQPSYYEAYSTTVTEAKVLQKPMVVTDVGGMRDQIIDGVTGVIVPQDISLLSDKIYMLRNNKSIRDKIIHNMHNNFVQSRTDMEKYFATVFR